MNILTPMTYGERQEVLQWIDQLDRSQKYVLFIWKQQSFEETIEAPTLQAAFEAFRTVAGYCTTPDENLLRCVLVYRFSGYSSFRKHYDLVGHCEYHS